MNEHRCWKEELVDGDFLNQIKPLNQFGKCKCPQKNHEVATFSMTQTNLLRCSNEDCSSWFDNLYMNGNYIHSSVALLNTESEHSIGHCGMNGNMR